MIKINLDNLDIKYLINEINKNNSETFLFFNDLNWDKLNWDKILQIIYFLNKYYKGSDYYFYNIPFCFFKKFGRNFIDRHCIRNRLCNYYDWYVTYNKCNKCRYWLFCNNFNSNISINELYNLESFNEEYINKDYLLNIILEYNNFILELWYKKNEVCFYATQKYIVEFLEWDIKYISKDFLSYLTIYFWVDNYKISKNIFESLDSSTLILKDKNIELNLNNLIKKYWVNINFTFLKWENIKSIIYKNNILKLEYYYSRLKYYWKRDFFDFTTWFYSKKIINTFKWSTYNSEKIILETKFKLIKKSSDILYLNSEVYMWRDIISWMNLNNYRAILISSDWLWEQWRLIQSLNSIKIPVIYNLIPDFTLYLKDWDNIKINFETWIIEKI